VFVTLAPITTRTSRSATFTVVSSVESRRTCVQTLSLAVSSRRRSSSKSVEVGGSTCALSRTSNEYSACFNDNAECFGTAAAADACWLLSNSFRRLLRQWHNLLRLCGSTHTTQSLLRILYYWPLFWFVSVQ